MWNNLGKKKKNKNQILLDVPPYVKWCGAPPDSGGHKGVCRLIYYHAA